MITERAGVWVRLAVVAAALVAVPGGCTSTSPRGAFEDVATLARQRSGLDVAWNNSTDPALAKAAEGLLSGEVSADAAVQVALLENRRLRATYEELSLAQADLVEAGLLRNPVFDAEVRFSSAGTGVEMAVLQDFLDVLYIPLRTRIAAAKLEAAKLRVTREVLALAGEVREAWNELVAAGQVVELRQTVLEASEASLETSRRLRQAGNITLRSYLMEHTARDRARIELAQAQAQQAAARERLASLMGVWGPHAEFRVPARLPEVRGAEQTPADAEQRAVASSLALLEVRRRVESAAGEADLSVPAALFSRLELGASAERDAADGKWAVGPAISLEIPIFNFGQARVARARAELRRQMLAYTAEAVEVRAAARAAAVRLTQARRAAEYYRRVMLPRQQQLLEQAQLEYNAMQIGVFELIQARREQVEAAAAYVAALKEYHLADAALAEILAGGAPAMQGVPRGQADAGGQPDRGGGH